MNMQTILQMPVMAKQTEFADTWFESRDDIIQYIDETVHLLSQMSQYSHACYSFYDNGQYYLKTLWDMEKIALDTIFYTDIEASLNYSNLTENVLCFQLLKTKIDSLFHLNIQSASSFLFPYQDQKILIVLFSEQQNVLAHTIRQSIQIYLDQRIQSVKQFFRIDDLQQQVNHLENINLGRAKYFSIIAHDLRAPFHGILGCADILAHERETLSYEEAQRLADYVHDTTQSTYGLLENLLNWAMAEGGRFHQKSTHFHIADIINFVTDLLAAFAFKKQIELIVDIGKDVFVYADKNMVTSVIQNLISNALKFTAIKSQKSIQISAFCQQDHVEIVIQDQGIGMTIEQKNNLFKDYAVPSTQGTSGEKGTGLGLVLCKRFMELNKGTIRVESVRHQGTTFILSLPLGQKPEKN